MRGLAQYFYSKTAMTDVNPKNQNMQFTAHGIGGYLAGFGLILYIPVNSYGHVGKVNSPNHTFFLGKPDSTVNQYFVHIL